MNLTEVLEQALVILKSIQDKEQNLNSQMIEIENIQFAQESRDKELKAREEAVKPLENAQVALAQAQKLRDAVEADRQALVEKEVKLENYFRAESDKLREKELALEPILIQADQIRADKLALVEEKKNYKAKIEKEIVEKFKKG